MKKSELYIACGQLLRTLWSLFFFKVIGPFSKAKGLKIQIFSLFSLNRLRTPYADTNLISRPGNYCSLLDCLQDCHRRFSKKVYRATSRVAQSQKISVFSKSTYTYRTFLKNCNNSIEILRPYHRSARSSAFFDIFAFPKKQCLTEKLSFLVIFFFRFFHKNEKLRKLCK